MSTGSANSTLPAKGLGPLGWIAFGVVALGTGVLAGASRLLLTAESAPSQRGMGGLILAGAAVFLPTVWFAFFAPFSRAVRFGLAAVVFAVTSAAMQSGEAVEQALCNILTFAFGLLALISLGIWLLLSVSRKSRIRLIGLVGVGIAAFLTVFKFEDPTGNMVPRIRYRFGLAHDRTLAKPVVKETAQGIDLTTTTEDDYPRFLGPDGDAIYKRPIQLVTDWTKNPPKQIWRKPIGAGWSAFAIVNGYAVTMEQRDTQELVTCYDLRTGELVWSHGIEARHDTALGGIGPRGTPTIFGGKVYALGATGVLRCLDGATGKLLWSHDLLKERKLDEVSDIANVAWGRAASPLIVDNLVVVPYGGRSLGQIVPAEAAQLRLTGPGEANTPQVGDFVSLVAFNKETGEPVWQGGRSQISYASPLIATLGDVRQIVTMNQDNVAGHDIATGKQLWQYYWPGESNAGANNSQPHVLPGDRVLTTKGYSTGAGVYHIKHDGNNWSVDAEPVWANRGVLKTKFNNVIVLNDHAYGLSEGVLECVDVNTGKRAWRGNRYGHGQLMLVGENLLVLGENGELALVAARPDGFEQLAMIQALEGKTWNNAALFGNLLLVRNAEEAACYELPTTGHAKEPSVPAASSQE